MFRMVRTRSASTVRSVMVTALLATSIAFVAPGAASPVAALSPDVVISQVYGGGGNSGATYTHDFVELFNRGSAPVSLAGWSVQYASSAGSTWATTGVSGTIQPGQYYLVQQAQGAGGTTPLPTPDAIGTTAMSGTNGKVALVNSTTALSGTCPAAVDFVGYGSSANCFEGAATGTLSNTTAASRNGDGCTETDNNSTDFTIGAPAPRNSASPLNPCGGPPIESLIVNEVDSDTPGTDEAEFVELYDGGVGNTTLDGKVVVFYNGSTDLSYAAYDLDGFSTDANGYFLLGNAGVVPTPSIVFGSNGLQNGEDAVALYTGDASSFPNGTAVTTTDLIDALVYDTSDPDAAGLLPLLNPGQPQVDENGNGNKDNESNQRCPNGSGGARNTDTYAQWAPTPGDSNVCEIIVPPEVCGDTFTPIYAVQGNGAASPLNGSTVSVEGIVVGDFQNNASPDSGDLNGFHVQDPTGDADPSTSDGVFVYAPGGIDVAMGDLVRVNGSVSEFNGLTEITANQVWVCSTGNPAPTATVLSLPVTSVDDFEPFEGMSVTFPQALVISEYFNFDRFNETVLTSERHLTPTAEFEPGPAAVQAAADFLLDKITLDDGRTNQNPDPAIHPNGGVFDLNNLFRGGDTVANVTGVLDYSFGLYRVQPTQGADYTSVNPRTAAPDPVGGNVTVSSFNVLNYFTTLDYPSGNPLDNTCGPLQNQECRGADDAGELNRQRDKIVSALAAIDADVFGLIEIENNVDDDAVIDLVDSLNAVVGAGTYDLISTGTIGTDAIKVAMIYKPAAVTPAGAYAILDGSVDARFLDSKNRPVLAQTFTHNATGSAFTVAVNHLKSKGSDCLDVGDPDTGDGAGNCNITRTQAAEALVDWLATDPTGSGDPDFLIIGDLNSYDKEDPIDAIIAAGYDDLVAEFLGEDAYSYVFDGQTGYLDHGLASSSLSERVSGVTVWHINADEADLIDYDTSFKGPNQDAIFAPDAYRSSDHDPVIIGLELESARSLKRDVAADLVSLLPTNDWRDAWRIVVATWRVEQSLHHSYWIDDTTLDARRGLVVFVRERQAVVELDRVSGVDVQFAIDALIDADRRLASSQLQAAIDASGSQHNIERAQAYLAAAEAEVADGDFDKAIAEFGKAWYQAVRAIG